MTISSVDPVALTADLVRCPSVTPNEAGAIALLQELLSDAGFECFRPDRGKVSNLYARWGKKGADKTFGFNGHIDVVPIGNPADWTREPFGAEIHGGYLWGRGSTDMKSGVAAFVAAAVEFVAQSPPDGALVVTITGDEEADAVDGTVAILDWMKQNDESMSVCLVGEPTCPDHMGEAMKIGRRGSMNVFFTASGVQGHSAYPHQAKNPVAAMAALAIRLATFVIDEGSDHFDPSSLVITTIDTGNSATNVIPATCKMSVNIRFNDKHTSQQLFAWLEKEAANISTATDVTFELSSKVSGESFLTPPGPLSELVGNAVKTQTNRTPILSTSGGTSDARFIKDHCPVVEYGLVGKTMHAVDERVDVAQINQLKDIYARIISDYFA